jgi:hypothetical protein
MDVLGNIYHERDTTVKTITEREQGKVEATVIPFYSEMWKNNSNGRELS